MRLIVHDCPLPRREHGSGISTALESPRRSRGASLPNWPKSLATDPHQREQNSDFDVAVNRTYGAVEAARSGLASQADLGRGSVAGKRARTWSRQIRQSSPACEYTTMPSLFALIVIDSDRSPGECPGPGRNTWPPTTTPPSACAHVRRIARALIAAPAPARPLRSEA
jgi:hypothetical protein